MAPLLAVALQAVPGLISLFNSDAGEAAEKVTGIVRSITGTEDPAQAAERLRQNSELMLQLKEALYSFQIAMEQEKTKRLQAINQTMQSENNAKNWWSSAWRPFWGAVSALAFLAVSILVCTLAYRAVIGGQPEAITMIPNLISSLAMLFGIPAAILGVASWHRGMERRVVAGEIKK